jgi:hypothetical protein
MVMLQWTGFMADTCQWPEEAAAPSLASAIGFYRPHLAADIEGQRRSSCSHVRACLGVPGNMPENPK